MVDQSITNWTSFDALSVNSVDSATHSPSLLSARIPIVVAKDDEEELAPAQIQVDPETVPELLTGDDLESCELAIDQFGEDLVANIMSVKTPSWTRENLFQPSHSTMEACAGSMSKEDQQLYAWVEFFFLRVLMRTSDNNPSIKLNAAKTVLDLIQHYYERLIVLCLGERMIRNMKDTKARLELVVVPERHEIKQLLDW
ncbi:hypothetical protein BD408DRAFT_429500 [Parasitella parasitica]|nr:hypothetical protein BD408DRAFT_429500 [Parasitella parasitica]